MQFTFTILMENGTGTVVGDLNQKINSDDVISKLKDDGDFDRLRLMAIRKLKENEELRNSIVSIVKQSVAINRPGAEKMKPRQLSDAIHQEVGVKLNEKVSDGLWDIIRSPDGMKSEITETVKSVYDKLSRPKRADNPESAAHRPKQKRHKRDHQKSNITSTDEITEPNEQLGSSQTVSHPANILNPAAVQDVLIENRGTETTGHRSQEVLKNDITRDIDQEQGDGSDEDPDAPPGFG